MIRYIKSIKIKDVHRDQLGFREGEVERIDGKKITITDNVEEIIFYLEILPEDDLFKVSRWMWHGWLAKQKEEFYKESKNCQLKWVDGLQELEIITED